MKNFYGDPHKSGSNSIPLSKAVGLEILFMFQSKPNDDKQDHYRNIEDQTNLII